MITELLPQLPNLAVSLLALAWCARRIDANYALIERIIKKDICDDNQTNTAE
jgi:hypothetical protein